MWKNSLRIVALTVMLAISYQSFAAPGLTPGIELLQVDQHIGAIAVADLEKLEVSACTEDCHVIISTAMAEIESRPPGKSKPGGKWLASAPGAGSWELSVWGRRSPAPGIRDST